MAQPANGSADHILPLYMNGLEGRMLRLPAKRKAKRELLFVYGQHSSLERWHGFAEILSQYGNVTVPDMPGFGGMTSLYKIGKNGSIDDLADYLAAFIKFRYKNQKIIIFGMSLGFVVITRMLQRYPDLTKNISLLVSIVGPGHKDDFIFSTKRRRFYACVTWSFSHWLTAWIFRRLFLNPYYLKKAYKHSRFAKEKFAELSGDEFQRTMETELELWKINDIRTQMRTNYEMMTLDNTKARVALPVHHVASKKDRYFNHVKVEEHFRQIFKDFHIYYTKDPNHAPTIIADTNAAEPFVPLALRKIIQQTNRKKRDK